MKKASQKYHAKISSRAILGTWSVGTILSATFPFYSRNLEYINDRTQEFPRLDPDPFLQAEEP